MWIFLVLVAVPIIEIALFIELGGWVGLWPTIGLVILTAILGAALLRAQGFAAMNRLQQSLEQGGDPTGPLAHGAMILVAGLLMLTPGFFTDTVGFLLLLPPVRSAIIAWAGPRLAARAVRVGTAGPQRRPPFETDAPIDVEYEDVTDDAVAGGRNDWDESGDDGGSPPRKGGSGWSRRPD